jgi:hypothetical protein
MDDLELLMCNMLDHFHEESLNYGGWDITVKTLEEALFINDEFKGILKATEDRKCLNFKVRRLKGSKFKNKHTVIVLRCKAESYKEEADRLHSGMKALLR